MLGSGLLRHILHMMQNVAQMPIFVEDRRVDRLPMALDKNVVFIAHIVALHWHLVRFASLGDPMRAIQSDFHG